MAIACCPEFEFKPKPPTLRDQVLTFAFTKFTKWQFVQINYTMFIEFLRLTPQIQEAKNYKLNSYSPELRL